MTFNVCVLNEMGKNERRVSVMPQDVRKILDLGSEVLVESGAGKGSFVSDDDYTLAGAKIVTDRARILGIADIIVMLQRPTVDDVQRMREGCILIGTIYPFQNPELLTLMAGRKLVSFSLELMPRTTRAQSMDILSSQSSVAGYRAAIVGAYHSPRFFPMLTTAAGTVKPASVLILGAGVAGLMAVATSKRLGASVTAYDVRRSAGDDVRSLGAKFLELSVDATGEGGYARDLTEEEKKMEQKLLIQAISSADVIITAAGVPGKNAPRIITGEMVSGMRPGSVIVDTNAEFGGNCELTESGKIIDTGKVKIIGLSNTPSDIAVNASQMYSRNVTSFLSILIDPPGNIADIDRDDLLHGCNVCRNGKITFPPLEGA